MKKLNESNIIEMLSNEIKKELNLLVNFDFYLFNSSSQKLINIISYDKGFLFNIINYIKSNYKCKIVKFINLKKDNSFTITIKY